MSSEIRRYRSVPGPDLSLPVKIPYDKLIKDLDLDAKNRLLGDDIQRLNKLFTEAHIPLPVNPLDRVKFLEASQYYPLLASYSGADEENPDSRIMGFTDRQFAVSFVCIEAAEQAPAHYGISKEEILRRNAMHELSHALQIQELWVPNNSEEKAKLNPRRFGIATSKPRSDLDGMIEHAGQRQLGEGLSEYVANISTGVDLPDDFTGYLGETTIAEFLVNKLGRGPLLRAMYTKNGLRELNTRMTQVFRETTLRTTLYIMGAEYVIAKMPDKNAIILYPKTFKSLHL